jgi:metal-responsive CopG/Arc/MetJ family transcriptional regulator
MWNVLREKERRRRCGGRILADIVMSTSIHIPKPLLEAVDRKARALKMSRNRLIVRALERELKPGADWSPGFFERLATVEPKTVAAVDEMLSSVRKARTSKPPRHF